ncbi:RNA polymerase sigma factor [Singulisphaera sp. Ch08]|uniref:RNA polymerase sigma factor n=1 Tax=Singulisphaera sp. Ch08 TaxID=3120278 RepID=A0AAU7C812_9BACT
MRQGQHGEVGRQIHTLFHTGTGAGLSDGQLLERFTTQSDEDAERAFAALVHRHGPTVLRVCRGVLRDTHDAEDAFQATFLVLAGKARSIRQRNSVGSWLYGVALRVSSEMRFVAARRRTHEGRVAGMKQESLSGEDDDSSQVVHEELARLPDRLRAAVVLCYLEGRTCEEAAHQLGWPVGTVKTRLGQARERLRIRLVRRGLTSLGSSAAVASSAEAMSILPTVPIALEATVVHAALRLTSGKAMLEVVSSSVITLAEGVRKAMFLSRLKLAVAAALAVGTVAVGTIVVARPSWSDSWRSASSLEGSRIVDLTSVTNTKPQKKAERVILAAADASDSGGLDDFKEKGVSHQELQVRLAHAKHLLQEKERLFRAATVPASVVEEVRLELDIIQARLDASKEDLEDELERLEGRRRVKLAELNLTKVRSIWAQHLHSQKSSRSEEAQSNMEIAVQEAEFQEVEIRIKQVRRRLGLK